MKLLVVSPLETKRTFAASWLCGADSHKMALWNATIRHGMICKFLGRSIEYIGVQMVGGMARDELRP
jgi:hypothetical protein